MIIRNSFFVKTRGEQLMSLMAATHLFPNPFDPRISGPPLPVPMDKWSPKIRSPWTTGPQTIWSPWTNGPQPIWSPWTNGPHQIWSPWTNGPQKFGPPGQMVPNQFGPHISISSQHVTLD